MRVLRQGSTGPAVQLLQLALNRESGGALALDGVFGPRTAAALRAFQRQQGLAPDGVAGQQSWRALQPWTAGYLVHRLRPGDTIFSVARRYGADWGAVLLANPGLEPENLPVGAELVVPLPFPVVPRDIAWCSDLVALCVQGLTARYPFLQSGEFGRSTMGKPLWSLSLGQGPNRVLYSAEHHANEWITTPVLLRFAEELCAAFAAGGELAGQSAGELLSRSTLTLVPAVNPDGMDLAAGELQSGPWYEAARAIAAAWPRYPFPTGWKANLRGVDLNLQYPAGWEQARENKLALGIDGPAPADFVGTAPLTEPESRALAALTERLDPALVLAYHSQGRVIYWQFENYATEQARQIAELFARVSGYAAEETPFAAGFAGYKDWFLQQTRRPGYTIEVGRGVNPLPLSQLDGIYADNLGILTLGALVT